VFVDHPDHLVRVRGGRESGVRERDAGGAYGTPPVCGVNAETDRFDR
jgi:hypothetical protein